MSLYYEAAEVIDSVTHKGGSLKSTVFGKKDWKSDPKALFALTAESSKWSEVLSEVIEKSAILKHEKQLTPALALLLTHDLLLSKRGPALPQKHGLATAISRHKARLAAELTKARLRRGFATPEALRTAINSTSLGNSEGAANGVTTHVHPRWIRVNALLSSVDEQLSSTFADYQRVESLQTIIECQSGEKLIHIDEHIPNLVAIPSTANVTSTTAYKHGKLILQDKASCFPAYLLNPRPEDGNIIDACAAPGNKTTHLAAILAPQVKDLVHPHNDTRRITACEKDETRSQTLVRMVSLAGADDLVSVRSRQDFLKTIPDKGSLAQVGALLLDPSCSGSGIVGRDESSVTVHLPGNEASNQTAPKGKKRKREDAKVNNAPSTNDLPLETTAEQEIVADESDQQKLDARLASLSTFQLRLLDHAMTFPRARRITYSTCSIYAEENEQVVVKALLSSTATDRGWRILRRSEQVEGLRKWKRRGDLDKLKELLHQNDGLEAGTITAEEVAEACIRCEKNAEDGTMGFFLVGFVRDEIGDVEYEHGQRRIVNGTDYRVEEGEVVEDEEEWNGFDD